MIRSFLLVLLLLSPNVVVVNSFQGSSSSIGRSSVNYFGTSTRSQISSSFSGTRWTTSTTSRKSRSSSTKSELNMFMGSDGGILGVGAPEVVTILLVGYFVLGPSDLYKLTKEIGKFVQNFQSLSAEATKTFENTMESQLQLDEIRKAQRELNDAFSFRRSINVDEDTEAFEVNVKTPREGDAAAPPPVETSTAPKKKRKVRRRIKKKEPEIEEDLSTIAANGEINPNVPSDLSMPKEKQERSLASVDEAAAAAVTDDSNSSSSWSNSGDSAMSAIEQAREELRKERDSLSEKYEMDLGPLPTTESAESRFQAQLAGTWNEQIMSKSDELSPLATIMDRLAILEEEKNAADARLQEEFRQREKSAENYYREKRKLLEEAAAQVQMAAYGMPESKNSTSVTATAAIKEESKTA